MFNNSSCHQTSTRDLLSNLVVSTIIVLSIHMICGYNTLDFSIANAIVLSLGRVVASLFISLLISTACLILMLNYNMADDIMTFVNIMQSLPINSAIFIASSFGIFGVEFTTIVILVFNQLWNIISSNYGATIQGKQLQDQIYTFSLKPHSLMTYYYFPLILDGCIESISISYYTSWFGIIETETGYSNAIRGIGYMLANILSTSNYIWKLVTILVVLHVVHTVFCFLLNCIKVFYMPCILALDKFIPNGSMILYSAIHNISLTTVGVLMSVPIFNLVSGYNSLSANTFVSFLYSIELQYVVHYVATICRIMISMAILTVIWIPIATMFEHSMVPYIFLQSALNFTQSVPVELLLNALCNSAVVGVIGKESTCVLLTTITAQAYYVPMIFLGIKQLQRHREKTLLFNTMSLPFHDYLFNVVIPFISPEIFCGLFAAVGASWNSVYYTEKFLDMAIGISKIPASHNTFILFGLVWFSNTIFWNPLERWIRSNIRR